MKERRKATSMPFCTWPNAAKIRSRKSEFKISDYINSLFAIAVEVRGNSHVRNSSALLFQGAITDVRISVANSGVPMSLISGVVSRVVHKMVKKTNKSTKNWKNRRIEIGQWIMCLRSGFQPRITSYSQVGSRQNEANLMTCGSLWQREATILVSPPRSAYSVTSLVCLISTADLIASVS